MKKIIAFCKKNYRIIIPILLVVVLALALIIYKNEYDKNKYRSDTTYNFYQYFQDYKYQYNMIVTTNRYGEIKDIKPEKLNINLDSTPIYYSKVKKVIFPSEISFVFPLKEGTQYKIAKNSTIEFKDNLYYLRTDKYNKSLDHFFIYDGEDMYFFIDEVTLNVDGNEIELSPMSYLFARYNSSIEYYDYVSDTYKIIDNPKKATVSNKYLEINLLDDYLIRFSNQILLSSDLGSLDLINEMK